MLPLVAMRDGEDPKPSRTDQFISALGLSSDIMEKLNGETDMKEVVSDFKNSFSGVLKTNFSEDWKKENEENLRKQTQIGTYNVIEKKLTEGFGLDADQFKDIDKGRVDAMLKAAKANFEKQVSEWKDKAAKSKDLPALEQYEAQLKAANEELKELRKIKESLPTQIEQARKGVLNDMFKKDHVRGVLSKLRKENKIVDYIDDETIQMHLNAMADLSVVESEGKQAIRINQKGTEKFIMRSNTDHYKNVELLVVDKILSPKNWVKKSNGPSEGGGTDMGKDKGGQQGGRFKINKKALNAGK